MALYAKQCAICHGAGGLGDGAAAYLLYPKPRNFLEGQFRLTSATSGLPTDEDLIQMLRRGMPGSGMPAWGYLPEQDLKALVKAVRQLATEAKVSQLMAKNKSLTREKALASAQNVLGTGPVAEIPAVVPADQLDLNRGKQIYVQSCAACHGADGKARERGDFKDISGYPSYARDFTAGILKGGADDMSLARRIIIGLPGSPMPGQPMEAKDLWSLVKYIQTMIKPGAMDRTAQTQKSIVARRVSAPLPADPGSLVWQEAPATYLAAMPLWWRDERVEGVTIKALHDGKNIAFLLSWDDASHNNLATKTEWFTDGVAMQFSADADPPFFGMGQKGAPVTLWHWKATWQRDVNEGFASLEQTYPNLPPADHRQGLPTEDTFNTGRGAGNPVSQLTHPTPVETLIAQGQGTTTSQRSLGVPVQASGRWANGQYQVVLSRPLATSDEGQISFQAGKPVSFALAVWDGQSGDRNGQKSVTIWHKLVIQKSGK